MSKHYDYEAHRMETCTLAGDFACRLTAAESNEWGTFVRGRTEFANYCDARAQCARAQMQLNDLEVAEAVRKEMAANKAMYAVAAEWYAGCAARRAAAEVSP